MTVTINGMHPNGLEIQAVGFATGFGVAALVADFRRRYGNFDHLNSLVERLRLVNSASLNLQEVNMLSVKILIDKASQICGSDAELARQLKISRSLVSLMKSGDRQVTPEIATLLADIAGENARDAAIDAVIENARGTQREGVLREILGKALAAGVAGVLAFSYSGDSKTATEKIATNDEQASHPIHRIYWILIQAWRDIRHYAHRSGSRLIDRLTWGSLPHTPAPIHPYGAGHSA